MKTRSVGGTTLTWVLAGAGLAATCCATDVISPCNGTRVLQQGFTDPLIGAAGSGDLEQVKRLIRKGHDVNYQECEDVDQADESVVAVRGWTPLMSAAVHGHVAIVRLLVDAGARLETQTTGGFTALSLAERDDRQESVAVLKELAAAAPPLFAPLPASSVFTGCGCSFADAADPERVLFTSNDEGAARVVVRTKVVELSATRPDAVCEPARVGDRCALKYRNEQLRVVIKARATWVCPDDSESCEVVRLEGHMVGRTAEGEKSVEVRGECGC